MNIQPLKAQIKEALQTFRSGSARENALKLLNVLGYRSDRTLDLDGSPEAFLQQFDRDSDRPFRKDKALFDRWKSIDFLFQLTDTEVRNAGMQGDLPFDSSTGYDGKTYSSYLFFVLELKKDHYTRTHLSQITREINRLFTMPVMVFFKQEGTLTLAVINRRISKRDPDKDVLKKVTLIKDIRIEDPHRAHIEILYDLSFPAICAKAQPSNFIELHAAWQKALDASELNKLFYKELALWYYWAATRVRFPVPPYVEDEEAYQKESLIRLVTRLIFIWFMREKELVPADILQSGKLTSILKDFDPQSENDSSFYKAILQNLFFSTLDTTMKERDFRRQRSFQGKNKDYMEHKVFRHEKLFREGVQLKDLFGEIPFLNGGLFECLDHFDEEEKVIRVDGFSDIAKHQPVVPNHVFFLPETDAKELGVDLNQVFDTRNKRYKVRGLIDLLENYKFTVVENTPIEEEIALDPELLGLAFENLLASYNPETGTTARKQTGSFYTPRVVVDFMVDESLIAYLKAKLLGPDTSSSKAGGGKGKSSKIEKRLRNLLSYRETLVELTDKETDQLIEAIDHCKIVDPACGSGAFPMGILHKLVHILQSIDPGNERWKTKLLDRTPVEIQEDVTRMLEGTSLDYVRKLGLIQNCIYGVDIQPIAIEIAKLRFFISLLVDYRKDPKKPNLGIQPLPNLDYKLMQGDSLIEDFYGISLSPETVEKEEQKLLIDDRLEVKGLIDTLWRKQSEYLNAWRLKDKERLKKEVEGTIIKIFHHEIEIKKKPYFEALKVLKDQSDQVKNLEQKQKYYAAGKAKIDKKFDFDFVAVERELREYTRGYRRRPFFPWHLYFAEVFQDNGGFDIALGNPPYVRQEKIRTLKPALQKQYECFTGTADLYTYFYERSITLLCDGGILTFISSNKFFRSGYGQKLRAYLGKNASLQQVIDFGDAPVFTAIAYPTIIVLGKNTPQINKFFAMTWKPGPPINDFVSIYEKQRFAMDQESLTPAGWRLESPEVLQLLEKLRNAGTPLGEYVNGRFYRGILTGLNEAFVVDRATRDRLIAEDPKSEEILKPFLRGRDVKRWRVEPKDLWLIFTRRGIDIKRYPAIKKHLEKYRKKLKPRPNNWPSDKQWSGRKPGSYKWYEIQDNIAYYKEFEEQQIVWGNLATHPKFSFANAGYYLSAPAVLMVTDNPYVLGILNSKLTHYVVSQSAATRQGGYVEFKPMYISNLSIPDPSQDIKAKIFNLVINAEKATGNQLVEIENRIDKEVYRLFNLTEEEITLIESSIGPSRTKAEIKSDLRSILLPALKEMSPYFNLETVSVRLKGVGIEAPSTTVTTYLSEFISEGLLYDAGRGWYSRIAKPFALDTAPVKKIITKIKKAFPLLDFSCWSTEQINPYMHHLLGKSVTFVYTDRDLMPAVYEELQGWQGYKVYLDPSSDEAKKNFRVEEKTIVIRPESKDSPGGEGHTASIEKLLTDLSIEVEKLPLMSLGEFQDMAWRAVTSARISMGTLLRYARRRYREPSNMFGENWCRQRVKP